MGQIPATDPRALREPIDFPFPEASGWEVRGGGGMCGLDSLGLPALPPYTPCPRLQFPEGCAFTLQAQTSFCIWVCLLPHPLCSPMLPSTQAYSMIVMPSVSQVTLFSDHSPWTPAFLKEVFCLFPHSFLTCSRDLQTHYHTDPRKYIACAFCIFDALPFVYNTHLYTPLGACSFEDRVCSSLQFVLSCLLLIPGAQPALKWAVNLRKGEKKQ